MYVCVYCTHTWYSDRQALVCHYSWLRLNVGQSFLVTMQNNKAVFEEGRFRIPEGCTSDLREKKKTK